MGKASGVVMAMECKCVRCGHAWVSRTAAKPKCCPNCKSYVWYVPIGQANRRRHESDEL